MAFEELKKKLKSKLKEAVGTGGQTATGLGSYKKNVRDKHAALKAAGDTSTKKKK